MPPLDPTIRFADLMAGPPELLPLDEAVLLVAAHDHSVDITAQRARLDALAARCGPATLDGVLSSLFGAEGFSGDVADYHHPDNSFLDRVMDRRRGLPILLGVLTTEVACRVGVCVAPVGMPGHFLVRDCEDVDTFIDPFHGGARLGRDDCEAIFRSLHPGAEFHDRFLEPVDSRAVLQRVVTNLVRSYAERGPARSLEWALHLRALAAVGGAEPWVQLARLRERLGDWRGAADAFARASLHDPQEEAWITRSRALTARLN